MSYLANIGNFLYLIIFLLGLILGSFLNSWVWRMHENIRVINGRSMCNSCRRRLTWYENIPLFSFLVLRGKCRTCKNQIPIHFLFVELGTALIFLLVAWINLSKPEVAPVEFFRDIIFSVLLIVVFIYDYLYQEILPGLVWMGALVGLFFNIYLGFGLMSMLIGVLVCGGFFFLQFAVSKGRWIGGGDVRLGIMMGIWLGWPEALVALFLAYIIGSTCSLFLLFLKKKQFSSAVPFGTYLAVSTFTTMLWGNQVVSWYLWWLK